MNNYSASKEVSLGDTLSQLLSDEDLHDVKLKGSDGVEVGANRYVLAARSSVFKAMLVGKFSEASGNTVDIAEYEGCILQAVVEYVHTDNPHMLSIKKRKATEDEIMDDSVSVVDTIKIQTLISLAAAAIFFDLPGLMEKVYDFLNNLLEDSNPISFALLEACNQQEPAVPDEITEFAWSQVRSSAKFVENTNAVACLSEDTLEEILKDEEMDMTEYDLFCLLNAWVESSPNDRKTVAKKLVNLIRLEGISPDHLSSSVEPSGVVAPEQLCKAYKAHSMAAKGHLSVEFCRKTSTPPLAVWSGTSSLDSRDAKDCRSVLLNCPPMRTGLYQWTLETVGVSDDLDYLFGVALKDASLDLKEWLTYQKGNWGFQTNGETYCEGEEDTSQPEVWSLAVGEQVALTLDLRKNRPGNGTLTGRIKKKNGNAVATAKISNLLNQLADDDAGFVPAVEKSSGGELGFQLIDFKKLRGGG